MVTSQYTAAIFHDMDMVSTILRFHDSENLSMLDQALFSLANQTYRNVQAIVVIQNGSESLAGRVSELIQLQTFAMSTRNGYTSLPLHSNSRTLCAMEVGRHRVISVRVPAQLDGRAILLNEGLNYAQGRFLGFLDYDDVLYEDAYEVLVGRLNDYAFPVAVGGCRKAYLSTQSDGRFYIESKESFLPSGDTPKSKIDLLVDNFIPIHSFLLDRYRIDQSELAFVEGMNCLEDYELLLRLISKYDFDFQLLYHPVCEYRIRLDGSNTTPFFSNCSKKALAWQQGRAYIEGMKNQMTTTISVREIVELRAEIDQLKAQMNTLILSMALKLQALINRYPLLRDFLLYLYRKVEGIARSTSRILGKFRGRAI